jgi:hypothetical protein
MESNAFKTFKTEEALFTSRAVVTLGAAAAGLIGVAVAFAAEPFGPAFVALTWVFALGGIVLALCPAPTRWFGTGLVFAGVALPLAFASWFWVALSAWVLLG